MPSLHWQGKEKVINHHLEVPFRVLEHQYGFNNGKQTKIETHSGNKIIHGDNLEALKALLPEYEGLIDCIEIDPPYNTGNDRAPNKGWIYSDNVNHPKIKKWLGSMVGKEGEDLSRHDKWLCMMYPRLQLLYKLLSEEAIIFIHIDDNEESNLRLIMDEIFGPLNFLRKIVWQRHAGGGNDSKHYAVDHEYILTYAKNKNKIGKIRLPLTEKEKASFKKIDDNFNKWGPYKTKSFKRMRPEDPREGLQYIIIAPDGTELFDEWKWEENEYKKGLQNGIVNIRKDRKNNWLVEYKLYLKYSNGLEDDDEREKVPRSMMLNTERNSDAKKQLTNIFGKANLFNNPKPVGLIQSFLSQIKNKNANILDSFSGSGTTAHAVLKLNQSDNGNRKFILIEMENYAETITAERIKRVIKGYGDDKGIVASFDYYELGSNLFQEDGNLNESVGIDKIRNYVYYSLTKTPLKTIENKDNKYFLNRHNDTAYYFFYEVKKLTTVNHKFLCTVKTKADQYVIFADNCLLTKDYMQKHNIIFKKIPRDITRF